MTPEWKLLINFCPKSAFQPRFTYYGQIWRKSAVAKLPKSHLVLLAKNTGVGTLFSPPFRPHLANRAQNFVNVVGLCMCRPVHVYRLWSKLAAVDLFRKKSKKVNTIQSFSLQLTVTYGTLSIQKCTTVTCIGYRP